MAGWRQQINRSSGGTHSTDDDNEAEEDKARAFRLVELRAQLQQEKEMARRRRREQQRQAAIDEEKKLNDSLRQLQKERLAYERQSSSSESLSTLHLAESERVKAAQLQQKHPAHTKQPVASSSPSDHSSADPRRVRPVQDVRELPAREKKSETPSYLSDHRSTETRRVMEAELQQERGRAHEKQLAASSSLSNLHSGEVRQISKAELQHECLAQERQPNSSKSLSVVPSAETRKKKPLALHLRRERLAHARQLEPSSSPSLSLADLRSAEIRRIREADADSASPVFVFFMNPVTSNDCLKLFFENSKRSGGGPVEEITRLNGVSAVIYFKNKQDAESVVRREKFTLDGHELLLRTPSNPDKIP